MKELTLQIQATLNLKKQTFSCMESVTGGGIAKEITSLSGISSCFLGGIVAYTKESKISFGVSADIIKEHGIVSKEVAQHMALRARDIFCCDWSIATTGVAGPEHHGGFPPGVAWIAISGKDFLSAQQVNFSGTREIIQSQVIDAALKMFLLKITENNLK